MKYLLLSLLIVSCASTKPSCVLVDRIEEHDALVLMYKCGNEDMVCRVVGNRARGCFLKK